MTRAWAAYGEYRRDIQALGLSCLVRARKQCKHIGFVTVFAEGNRYFNKGHKGTRSKEQTPFIYFIIIDSSLLLQSFYSFYCLQTYWASTLQTLLINLRTLWLVQLTNCAITKKLIFSDVNVLISTIRTNDHKLTILLTTDSWQIELSINYC